MMSLIGAFNSCLKTERPKGDCAVVQSLSVRKTKPDKQLDCEMHILKLHLLNE